MLVGKTTLLERPLSELVIGSFVPGAAGREPTGGTDGVKTKFAGVRRRAARRSDGASGEMVGGPRGRLNADVDHAGASLVCAQARSRVCPLSLGNCPERLGRVLSVLI